MGDQILKHFISFAAAIFVPSDNPTEKVTGTVVQTPLGPQFVPSPSEKSKLPNEMTSGSVVLTNDGQTPASAPVPIQVSKSATTPTSSANALGAKSTATGDVGQRKLF